MLFRSSQAIWVLDAGGRLSAIIKSISGDNLDYLKARNWLDLVHTDDREGAAAAMQTAIRTKSAYEHEHRILDREGRT